MKVSGTSSGCLQSVDSLVHIPMLAEDWKIWIKSDEFFRSHSLRLFLVKREILIQTTEKEPVLLKFIADKYKTQKICEKTVEVKEVDIAVCSWSV